MGDEMLNDDGRSKLVSLPTAEDELRGSIEAAKRIIPLLAEQAETIARARKLMFDAHVKVGFTEAQAIDLCKSFSL